MVGIGKPAGAELAFAAAAPLATVDCELTGGGAAAASAAAACMGGTRR